MNTTANAPPESDLIARAKQGDHIAFAALYKEHRTMVLAEARKRVRDEHHAQDVTSETFLKAWRNLYAFKGGRFGAWLRIIARNTCHDYIKHSYTQRVRPVDELPEPRESAPGGTVVDSGVWCEVAKLPLDQRTVLYRRFVDDMTLSEVAQTMGRSVMSVMRLQLRAIDVLAKALAPDLTPRSYRNVRTSAGVCALPDAGAEGGREEWAPLPGWPCQVSDRGRVKGPSGKVLRPFQTSTGQYYLIRGRRLVIHGPGGIL